MSNSMTAAQSAQQNNRGPGGQYSFGTHAEPEGLELDPAEDPFEAQRTSARPVTEPLFRPLSAFELGQRYDDGQITAVIPVQLENLDVNRDGFNDGLFEKAMGMNNEEEAEVEYRATGVTPKGQVLLTAEIYIELPESLDPGRRAEFEAGQADRAGHNRA